ncbi:MAG: hypothetical protein ACSHX6_01885 [Akkermansiaceae bacterium]
MLKAPLRHIIITLAIVTNIATAFDLKPGDRFPDLQLPSIKDSKESSISELTDKKLMLHLFASW